MINTLIICFWTRRKSPGIRAEILEKSGNFLRGKKWEMRREEIKAGTICYQGYVLVVNLECFKAFDVCYLLEQSAVVVASSISSKHNESYRGIMKISNCDRPSPCTVWRSSYSLIFTVAFRKSKLYSFEGLWMRITKGYVLLLVSTYVVCERLSVIQQQVCLVDFLSVTLSLSVT